MIEESILSSKDVWWLYDNGFRKCISHFLLSNGLNNQPNKKQSSEMSEQSLRSFHYQDVTYISKVSFSRLS